MTSPEHVREDTVVPSRVVDPPVCEILPEVAKDVCVPILVTLFCVAVANVPVSVAPETSPVETILSADKDPVVVIVEALRVPASVVPLVRVLVVTAPFDVNESAVTFPVKTVVPTLDAPTFCKIVLTGSPPTDRVVHETFVAATSTASRFFIWQFIVVGMKRGLVPQLFILVNITFGGYFIPDLVPLLQVLAEDHIGVVLA